MPSKYIAIAIALLVSHSSVFIAGYYKKGETEAEKTTVAITEAVEKEAKTQDSLIEIGLEQADKEIDIKVITKVIEMEVIKNVEKYVLVDMCYSDDGVQSINKALGYSKGKGDEKLISSLSRSWESEIRKIRGHSGSSCEVGRCLQDL